MSKIERMTVVFPQPMAAGIRAAVERGDYASTSEVVRDAVRLWQERQEFREREREAIREAWREGKASGVSGPYDMQTILRDVRAVGRTPRRSIG